LGCCCDAVARLIVEAACRAAATNFLLLRQKKVSKEKATLLPVSLRSNNCGQFDDDAVASCGATAHPVLCAPRHG